MNFGRGGFQVSYPDLQWPIGFNRQLYGRIWVRDLGFSNRLVGKM